MVNAYEPHEHVYERLRVAPGTVVIRGGGIVASRVLQRLIDDRDRYGLQTQIIHVFRTYITGAHGPHLWMRRRGGDGWAYQGFNYPKSVWGGQLKARDAQAGGRGAGATRTRSMGGTNTPKRKLWQQQMARRRRERLVPPVPGRGHVDDAGPAEHRAASSDDDTGRRHRSRPLAVIDCTGLEADIREHRVLADLLDHGGAGRNPLGRLDVERNFEVKGTRSRAGRMYASGSGHPRRLLPRRRHVPRPADRRPGDRRRPGQAGFCTTFGPLRSTSQWWRWARPEI